MAESITSLAPRPAASLVAAAAGEHLPSYVTREQARRGFPELAPDVAFEVRSVNDTWAELRRKADEYVAAGTQLVDDINGNIAASSPASLVETRLRSHLSSFVGGAEITQRGGAGERRRERAEPVGAPSRPSPEAIP